jgi:hypothetical protein
VPVYDTRPVTADKQAYEKKFLGTYRKICRAGKRLQIDICSVYCIITLRLNPTENMQRELVWMTGGQIQGRREQKRSYQDEKPTGSAPNPRTYQEAPPPPPPVQWIDGGSRERIEKKGIVHGIEHRTPNLILAKSKSQFLQQIQPIFF